MRRLYFSNAATVFAAALYALLLAGCAAKEYAPPAPLLVQSGTLPEHGTVIIRSGLAWRGENSPLFKSLFHTLEPALTKRGLNVSLPQTPSRPLPIPGEQTIEKTTVVKKPPPVAHKRSDAPGAHEKGNFTPLKLKPYTFTEFSTPVPASVTAIRPPDARAALFALSQKNGTPILRAEGFIPGRIPAEMITQDSKKAEYTLLCRVAYIAPDVSGLATASGPIGGVGRLGYGAPAIAGPAPRGSFGSAAAARRGYEGNSPYPGDPWHREADLNAPGYRERYAPRQQFATPPTPLPGSPAPQGADLPVLPKPPLLGDGASVKNPKLLRLKDAGASASSRLYGTYGAGVSAGAGGGGGFGKGFGVPAYGLEMELYALAPVKKGAKGKTNNAAPSLVWRSALRLAADGRTLEQALPEMVQITFTGL